VVVDEVEAAETAGNEEEGEVAGVDEADVVGACRSWRSSLREEDVEEEEEETSSFPRSGRIADVHGGGEREVDGGGFALSRVLCWDIEVGGDAVWRREKQS
jgi:hypothetical protein